MRPQPEQVAVRLGLDETTIRRLQAHGHLSRLALTEPEIRERLYQAHLGYLLSAVSTARTPPVSRIPGGKPPRLAGGWGPRLYWGA